MDCVAEYEIMRELPSGIPGRYLANGSPLLTAYGCVLLERWVGKSYVYKAVNLKTGRSAQICRRVYPLKPLAFAEVAGKIRDSGIAGRGRLEIDMEPGESLPAIELAEIQSHIFKNILPGHNYGIREKQIELADHIFSAMSNRVITLSEAGVGIGKTHAYLIAAALVKRGRINDFWLRGKYPNQSYADSAYMPVVISTSSIALQKAIVTEYIPEISNILLTNGIIKTPLSCVIRKGRGHYICEKRLRQFFHFEPEGETKRLLKTLLDKPSLTDLGEIDGITAYVKRKIGVSGRCDSKCPCYKSCRYLKHMEHVQSSNHDFQVCNHNYLLADTIRRSKGQRPLIPHYQAVIIDEAHKFLQAARQMYGTGLESRTIANITEDIRNFKFGCGQDSTDIQKLAIKLAGQNKRLFRLLNENIPDTGYDDDAERFAAVIDRQAAKHLKNIRNIIDELIPALSGKTVLDRYSSRYEQALWNLSHIRDQAAILERHGEHVCWLEKPEHSAEDETRLCSIPKRLNEMLYADLWSKGIPIVLTSGTLAACGSFEHVKKNMGFDRVRQSGLMETSKPSPFNYRENTLLYISNNVPFPNNKDKQYLKSVGDEIRRLVAATHGHTAVLFTSYNAMGIVFTELNQSGLAYPLFRLDRGDTATIEQFKRSRNGVLFASGSLWEGINLPGDILSLLVIVKLPFAVPDPISEYERTQYSDMEEYKNAVIAPEMLVKLKQGFGRLIRTETDTGVVALLDSRVRNGGTYRDRVLSALPDCPVTDDIGIVEAFMHYKKEDSYFYRKGA